MACSFLIVVPTLNSHALLPKLLCSLQSQSWQHWRVVFIDGPSGPQHRQWLQQCCADEPRCSWQPQSPEVQGIFGAMSQGFALAAPDEWVLFWGSDDWAAGPDVLQQLMQALPEQSAAGPEPDLLVCRGRYANAAGALGRSTVLIGSRWFSAWKVSTGVDLSAAAFRRLLFWGATPPHQATLFGPGAMARLNGYREGLRLAADLDYFLRLSRHAPLLVRCLDLELVHMADGGVSGQQTQRRLQEVRLCYRRAFGWCWWVPFAARYVRRLLSLVVRP